MNIYRYIQIYNPQLPSRDLRLCIKDPKCWALKVRTLMEFWKPFQTCTQAHTQSSAYTYTPSGGVCANRFRSPKQAMLPWESVFVFLGLWFFTCQFAGRCSTSMPAALIAFNAAAGVCSLANLRAWKRRNLTTSFSVEHSPQTSTCKLSETKEKHHCLLHCTQELHLAINVKAPLLLDLVRVLWGMSFALSHLWAPRRRSSPCWSSSVAINFHSFRCRPFTAGDTASASKSSSFTATSACSDMCPDYSLEI